MARAGMHQADREVGQLQSETVRDQNRHERRTKAVEDEQAETKTVRGKGTTNSANSIVICSIDLAEGDAFSVTAQLDGQRRDNTGDAQFHITAGVNRTVGGAAAVTGQTSTNYGSAWTGLVAASGNSIRLTAADVTGNTVDWNGSMSLKRTTARKAVSG